jgi:hypothetical protein
LFNSYINRILWWGRIQSRTGKNIWVEYYSWINAPDNIDKDLMEDRWIWTIIIYIKRSLKYSELSIRHNRSQWIFSWIAENSLRGDRKKNQIWNSKKHCWTISLRFIWAGLKRDWKWESLTHWLRAIKDIQCLEDTYRTPWLVYK